MRSADRIASSAVLRWPASVANVVLLHLLIKEGHADTELAGLAGGAGGAEKAGRGNNDA